MRGWRDRRGGRGADCSVSGPFVGKPLRVSSLVVLLGALTTAGGTAQPQTSSANPGAGAAQALEEHPGSELERLQPDRGLISVWDRLSEPTACVE